MLTTVMSLGLNVAVAAGKSCGTNASYVFDSATGTLTISGTGATNDYNLIKRAPWTNDKPNITKIVVGEGITEIGEYNFYNCTALTEVSLPSTLTTLAGSGTMTAGYGCFQKCTSLKTIILPEGLKTIERCAFKECTSLTKIVFPNSVTSIGYGAFAECSALETVTFGSGLTETGDSAFYNAGVKTINFGENIQTVSTSSFLGCKMTKVELPESVTAIDALAFKDCSFLTTVTVNNAKTAFGTKSATTPIGGDPFNGSKQALTIRGHKGSTAEEYAAKYNYAFESMDACTHANTFERIKVEATCTTDGAIEKVCSECGDVVGDDIVVKALGHNYETLEVVDNTNIDGHIYTSQRCSRCSDEKEIVEHQKATDGETRYVWIEGFYTYKNTATCTTPGTATYTCNVDGCYSVGKIKTMEVLDVSLGSHTVDEYTITKAPTCTESGTEEGTCVNCGETVSRTIAATGHNYDENDLFKTIDNSAEDGHIHRIYICKNCNEQVDETEHVAWIEGFYNPNVITPARCVIDGLERDTCNLCDATRNVVLKANGQHDWYETSTSEPTCTTAGQVNYACRNCSQTKSDKTPALGHDYVMDASKAKAPTCTEPGYDYYQCSRCPAVDKPTVPKTGHTVNENVYQVISEPTCEEDGSAVSSCLVCSAEFEVTLKSPGHDYEDHEIDLTSEGKPGHVLVTPTCKVCGSTKKSEIRHKEWLDGYFTTSDGAPPSCSVEGYTKDTCTICNAERRNPIPALGHNYNYTGRQTIDGMVYRCSICLVSTTTVKASEVFALWGAPYVNKHPSRTAVDNSSLLDTNGDNVINLKDYQQLKICLREEKRLDEEQVQPEEEKHPEENNSEPTQGGE